MWGRNSHCGRLVVMVINPIVAYQTWGIPYIKGIMETNPQGGWSTLASPAVSSLASSGAIAGLDGDVQCHVPCGLGCQWFLCAVARQLMLWYWGTVFDNKKSTQRCCKHVFLVQKDLVAFFWGQSRWGWELWRLDDTMMILWVLEIIFGSKYQ